MGVKLTNINAAYGNNVVLENINLELQMGKINALIGPCGSGKTTLVEIITMFQKPTSGKVELNDKRIGFVFEFPDQQFFKQSVFAELQYGLKDKKNVKRISDVLKMVGLDDSFLEKNPHHLSNGEKRKVAIAAILITNPDIIIFDEPTVGLDRNSKNNLIRLMKILQQKYKKTIVVVSQDIDFVYDFVDYVYLLYDKKLVAEGPKLKILSNYQKLKKYQIIPPKLVALTNKINNEKNLKLKYRDNINDLLKDMYRYVK